MGAVALKITRRRNLKPEENNIFICKLSETITNAQFTLIYTKASVNRRVCERLMNVGQLH